MAFKAFDPALGTSSVTGGGTISGAGTYVGLFTTRPSGGRVTGYQVVTTDGGSLAGTLTFEGSQSTEQQLAQGNGVWTKDEVIGDIAISGAMSFQVPLELTFPASRIRPKFVRSAGTGTITATVETAMGYGPIGVIGDGLSLSDSGTLTIDRSVTAVVYDNAKSYQFRRALDLLDITDTSTVDQAWQDFLDGATGPAGWVASVGVTGAVAPAMTAVAGGVVEFKTGATNGSSAGGWPGAASNATPIVDSVTGSKWCLTLRFKLTTAIDAQATLVAGLVNNAVNKTITFGFCGALNTDNFVVQYDGFRGGTAVDTGESVDTDWHIVDIYGKGDGKYYWRFDGSAESSAITPASAPTDAMGNHIAALNGTTNANRSIYVDYMSIVFTR